MGEPSPAIASIIRTSGGRFLNRARSFFIDESSHIRPKARNAIAGGRAQRRLRNISCSLYPRPRGGRRCGLLLRKAFSLVEKIIFRRLSPAAEPPAVLWQAYWPAR